MISGGITEIIWHFAGYLRIFDDIARFRIAHDEGAYRSHTEDYTTNRPQFAFTPIDDEMSSRPVAIQNPSVMGGAGHHAPTSHLSPVPDVGPDKINPIHASGFLPPMSPGAGGGVGGSDVIKVVYQEEGAQSEVQTRQFNHMYDNDALVGTQDSNLLIALRAESDHAIATMIDGADSAIPVDWRVPSNTADLPAFVVKHHQALADRDGAPDPHSVQQGYYVNGVLQDPALRPPDQLSASDPAPVPDFGSGPGQWALDGGNTATNGAYIVDLTGSARTMLVVGDYYKTNAIVQTNSYMDNDHVTVGGSGVSVVR